MSDKVASLLGLIDDSLREKRPDAAYIRDLFKVIVIHRNEVGTVELSPIRRAKIWQCLLGVDNVMRLGTKIDDVVEDLVNQKVVNADVKRSLFSDDEESQAALCRLLTFFCKESGVRYKQGLHEILVPFMLLQSPRLPDEVISNMFLAFIVRFMPHNFDDDDFNALQCSFKLFRLLLLYHDPELCNLLDQNSIGPELYATSWFMTLFAHSTKPVELLFEIWEFYLSEDDQYLHFFVALRLLLASRDEIFKADRSILPQVLSKLHVTEANIKDLCIGSRQLQKLTPKSMCNSIHQASFAAAPPTAELLKSLESCSSMHVSAAEIIKQYDPSGPPSAMKFFILDCRSTEEYEVGRLSGSLHVNRDLHDKPEELAAFIDSLREMKGCHFCVMGHGRGVALSGSSAGDAEWDVITASDNTLDEDLEVTRLLLLFLQRGFPFVSQLSGGYKAMHELIMSEHSMLDKNEVLEDHSDLCSECGGLGFSLGRSAKSSDFLHNLFFKARAGGAKAGDGSSSLGLEVGTDGIAEPFPLPTKDTSQASIFPKKIASKIGEGFAKTMSHVKNIGSAAKEGTGGGGGVSKSPTSPPLPALGLKPSVSAPAGEVKPAISDGTSAGPSPAGDLLSSPILSPSASDPLEGSKDLFEGMRFDMDTVRSTIGKSLNTSWFRKSPSTSEAERVEAEYFHVYNWTKELESESESIVATFASKLVQEDGILSPRIIAISNTDIYVIELDKTRSDFGKIDFSFPLIHLSKITSRKAVENLCKFHYHPTKPDGTKDSEVMAKSFVLQRMRECIQLASLRFKRVCEMAKTAAASSPSTSPAAMSTKK